MTALIDIIEDYSPPNTSVGVPLGSTITMTFDRLMDESDLGDNLFVAGPDTDQFIGPGISEFNIYPDNVSQGDDFLQSPGYTGIVEGTFTYETLAGNKTKVTFTPSHSLAALTEYTVHLPEATDEAGTTYTGHVTFTWTTGSGSIEALPSSSSTSVLMSITPSSLSSSIALGVVKTTPVNHSVENNVSLSEIIIEFNKDINSDTVTRESVEVKAVAATDHPSATVSVNEDIATKLTVEGKKIIIEI